MSSSDLQLWKAREEGVNRKPGAIRTKKGTVLGIPGRGKGGEREKGGRS